MVTPTEEKAPEQKVEVPSSPPAVTPSIEERLKAMEQDSASTKRELESTRRANQRLQSERDQLRNQVKERETTIRTMREDAELAGLDDEGEKARRREIVKRERELEEARELVRKREEELNAVAGEILAERYANQYGVPKETLLQYSSDIEMRAAALEAALKAKNEAPPPAPTPPPPPKQESGESLVPRKRVQDMTEEEFKAHYKNMTGRTLQVRS